MSNVKKDLLKGVFWSAIEKYSSQIVGIIVSMILARLLCPSDFGVVAISTVIIGFLSMFCSIGIGPAIIQRDNLSIKDLNNIFSFTVIIGLFLSVLLFFFSKSLSVYFEESQLEYICKILSISLFFSSINIVPNAMMMKNKRFKDMARRTIIVNLLCGFLSVWLAFCGLGVFTLVVSPVLYSIFIFFWNSYYYRYKLRIAGFKDSIIKIASFSIFQFLFELVNYFSRNLDKIIIGKYLSTSNLGLYEKSYRLMQLPLNNLTSVINPVLQPVLKDFQAQPLLLAENYNKIIKFISTISFPLGVTLHFSAYEIIILFFGNQWVSAVGTFSVLALSIPTQLILSTSGSVFQSVNATKHLFWTGVRNSSMTISAFLIAAYYFRTIEAVAWAWTITSLLCFTSSYVALYIFVLKSPIKTMLKELINPFINSLILIVFFVLVNNHDNIVISLFVKLFGSFILSLVFIQITNRYNIVNFIKKKNVH